MASQHAGGRTTPTIGSTKRMSMLQSPSSGQQTNGTVDPTSVKVVVRIRPSDAGDFATIPSRFQRTVVNQLDDSMLQVEHASPGSSMITAQSAAQAKGKLSFTFDTVIGPQQGQSDVYQCAAPLVTSFLDGMNATVLAYGQTSSGKSYTMGTDRITDHFDGGPERLGLTPRAISQIFESIEKIKQTSGGTATFQIKVSYVEIYNEELIDLLAGMHDARPLVQIREDKQGNIFWSGLREMKVSSPEEVMRYLEQGSALRQTGATDMNAQSSRSHAIFSLTLTQRRPAGMQSPSRSTSSASNRRQSGIPRSPVPGSPRPSTPNSERGSSRLSFRGTASSASSRPGSVVEELRDEEAHSTLVSKFHFVDLAGSERLKRTAAHGERVKEGISINAGLHALGNVISALGDPAKARSATHIPYRDSKLTRLLQDSLGGNARTMMIACVSPVEYNVGETISTLKYANRARNIKNKATVNEVEAGWDDVEHLQKTILRLRAELGAIKAGGPIETIREEGRRSIDMSSTRELQDRYIDLQQRHAQLTADYARYNSSAASDVSSNISRDDFARAVEPIVEEYEKTLSAIESQLALTKAALGHSEEEMRELESQVVEHQRSFEAANSLVGDLKNRIARLAEREMTTEAYVRDLESKLKDAGDKHSSHGDAVAELRKELAKHKEQAATTEAYVKDLESRLSQTDEVTSSLKRQIQLLERDIERREEAHKDLESRLNLLDTNGDTKALLQELDERERRLLDLQREVDELRQEKEKAQEQLSQRAPLPRSESRKSLQDRPNGSGEARLTAQLRELQDSYERTVVQLGETSNSKKQALDEVERLKGELDAKDDVFSIPASSSSTIKTIPENEGESTSASPRAMSKANRVRRSVPLSPSGLSFLGQRGQGATAAHNRSVSLSQELSSAQSQPTSVSPTSPSSANNLMRGVRDSPSSGAPPEDKSFNRNAADEIARLKSVINDRDAEILKLQLAFSRRTRSNSSTDATVSDQEKAARRLSGTEATVTPPRLTRVDAEGMMSSPRESVFTPRTRAAFDAAIGNRPGTPEGAASSQGERLEDLMRAMARKESAHREYVEDLQEQLATLRKQHEELTTLSRDQVVNMSSEIEKLRAELESRPNAAHFEQQIAAKESELNEARSKAEEAERNRSELVSSHENAISTQLSEIETLKGQLADREGDISTLTSEHAKALDEQGAKSLADMEQRVQETREAMERAHSQAVKDLETKHSEETTRLVDQHELERSALSQQSETTAAESVAALSVKHNEEVAALRRSNEEAQADLSNRHESTLASLRDEHERAIRSIRDEHARALEDTRANEGVLTEKHEQLVQEQATAHSRELEEVRSQHSMALEQLKVSHQDALEQLRREDSSELDSRNATHQDALSQVEEDKSKAISQELERLAEEHRQAVAELSSAHDQALKTIAETHSEQLAKLKEQHDSELAEERERQQKVEEELQSVRSELAQASETLARDRDAHQKTVDEHVQSRTEMESSHSTSMDALRSELQTRDDSLKELQDAHDELRTRHDETAAAHQAALSEVEANRSTIAKSEEDGRARAVELDSFTNEHEVLRNSHAALRSEHESLREAHASLERDSQQAREASQAEIDQTKHSFDELSGEHGRLRDKVDQLLLDLERQTSSHNAVLGELEALKVSHSELVGQHEQVRQEKESALRSLEEVRREHAQSVDELATVRAETVTTQEKHASILQQLRTLSEKQDSIKEIQQQQRRSGGGRTIEEVELVHRSEMAAANDALSALEKALHASQDERHKLIAEMDGLKQRIEQMTDLSGRLEKETARSKQLESELVLVRADRDRISASRRSISSTEPSPLLSGSAFFDAQQDFSTTASSGRGSPFFSGSPQMRNESRFSTATIVPQQQGPPPTTPLPAIPEPSQHDSPVLSRRGSAQSDLRPSEDVDGTIQKLQKQLAHCESDLRANMDLVSTLESALNESERNLRKARVQMNELARERDSVTSEKDDLKRELRQQQVQTESIRNSVAGQVEAREQRLREEQDRVKAQFEARLAAMNSTKKKNKFNCF